MTLTVGFAIFPGAEEMDVVGPFEALALARDYGKKDVRLLTVAESTEPVQLRGGLRVVPDRTFDDVSELDVVVVPGGPGTRDEAAYAAPVAWLERRIEAPLTTSVCTGSFLLGRAGLLDGRAATTHHSRLDEFQAEFPAVDLRVDERVVDGESVITAGGVTSGIDLGLHLIDRFFGPELRDAVSDVMEYPASVSAP